jgi:hypothetical protein
MAKKRKDGALVGANLTPENDWCAISGLSPASTGLRYS